ncbi:hypothetical protein GGP68_003509 [Salinibacter ruber]|uniref:Uncharacterized protein n=1 Tax=Salinibacter ruber TaxID=146919 RepID=A0A9X2Q5A6_9BACT|nr:hypothetical protein [Salinibacter ruber]MCS3711874.1 hypothetical protein [Salinibacter ruber]
MVDTLAKMYRRVRQTLFSDRTQDGTVVLDDLDGPSIQFTVQSGVERYRTAQLSRSREEH